MSDTPSALAAANSRRHQATLSAARRAINDLQTDRTTVTFTAVAKASGVARSWLYDNAEIRQLIGKLRGEPLPGRHDETSAPALRRCRASPTRRGWRSPGCATKTRTC
jgi:hypothetical protein